MVPNLFKSIIVRKIKNKNKSTLSIEKDQNRILFAVHKETLKFERRKKNQGNLNPAEKLSDKKKLC